MKEIHIHMGMFDFGVNVAIGGFSNLNKYVRYKLEDETMDIPDIARGWYIARRGFCPIIWIPQFPKTPRQHATLAHEAIHVACRLMEWAAIPKNEDTEEVLTHATAHIVNAVLEQKKKM